MSSNIQFAGPFLKGFTHQNYTATTTPTTVVSTADAGTRRAGVIIQNQSATVSVNVVFADTGSVGVLVYPQQTLTIDNYNGPIRLVSTSGSQTVHIAIAKA
jgi:hypothetical protein